MARKSIGGGEKLAKAIRSRRIDLDFTIEEAAQRAGVGTKTWSRYEAGEPIRADKCLGVCRALEWRSLPGGVEDPDRENFLKNLKRHKAWSSRLAEYYGEHAAASFAVGSDVLLTHLDEELSAISELPKGSHIGQLSFSLFKDILPQQFLMSYDYDFLYRMKTVLIGLRTWIGANTFSQAHTVLEELIIYLCVEESCFLKEERLVKMTEDVGDWDEWIYELFEDQDMNMFLYSDWYVEKDSPYHFDHWLDHQFWCWEKKKDAED